MGCCEKKIIKIMFYKLIKCIQTTKKKQKKCKEKKKNKTTYRKKTKII